MNSRESTHRKFSGNNQGVTVGFHTHKIRKPYLQGEKFKLIESKRMRVKIIADVYYLVNVKALFIDYVI